MQVSIPKGWTSAKLRDVAELERDSIQPANISTGTTYVGLENIVSDGTFLNVGSVDEGELASSKFSFGPDHLLYGKLRPYLRKIIRPDFHGVCSTDILPLKPSARINKDYLFHYLRQPSMVELATCRCSGANLPRLSPQTLLDFPVTFPPLPEQKRIAAILDKADSIRCKRQEAVRLTEELLRSVFLDMFGDPVTNPKGWETGLLGDYCDMETGYAFKSEAFQKSGVRLCRGANVLPGELDWSDVKFWSNDSKLAERYILQEGDIVLAMDRPWISTGLKVARVSHSDIPSYLVQRVARLRAIKGLSNEFIYFCIKHPYFMKHCVPKMTETTIPHISPLDIRSFPVLLPDATRVKHFSKIALKVIQTESTLLKCTHDTDTLFNSLLQRAFKGEL